MIPSATDCLDLVFEVGFHPGEPTDRPTVGVLGLMADFGSHRPIRPNSVLEIHDMLLTALISVSGFHPMQES